MICWCSEARCAARSLMKLLWASMDRAPPEAATEAWPWGCSAAGAPGSSAGFCSNGAMATCGCPRAGLRPVCSVRAVRRDLAA